MGFFSRIASRFARAPRPETIGRGAPRDLGRWPQWLSAGLTIERLAAIQRNADLGMPGDLMALEQEIAGRDPLISGLLSTRLAALSQRPVRVKPSRADRDKSRAQAAADFGQRVLEGLRMRRLEGDRYRTEKGLSGVVEWACLAAYYGAEVGFIHWECPTGEPRPRPVAIEPVDERRLCFDVETEALRITTKKSGYSGVYLSEFDPAQVLEIRNTRISRRISYAGSARACLLPWWVRFGSIKDLTGYLESWARPSLIGKTSKDAPGSYGADNLGAFKNLVEDFMGDTRSVLPPGFELQILQAVAGGEAVFEAVDRLTERHLMFALTGQTGAGSGDKTTMASAEVDERVRADLTEGDARMVGEALEALLGYAVAVEFGAGCPAPEVGFEQDETTESMRARSLVVQGATYPLVSLLNRGIPVDVPEYCRRFDIPLREDGKPDPLYPSTAEEQAQAAAAKSCETTQAPGAGKPPPDPAALADPGAAGGSFALSAYERQVIEGLRAAHGKRAPEAP